MSLIEQCPCCDRKFQSVSDYPLILLNDVQRFEVPTRWVFRGGGGALFVDAEGKKANNLSNSLVPEPVFELFQSAQADQVDFEGCEWSRNGSLGHFTYKSARIEELGEKRDQIIDRLNPYFTKLEEVVGTEINTSLLTPPSMEDLLGRMRLGLTNGHLADFGTDLSTAHLEISYVSGHISLMQMVSSLARLATFEYEGRVRVNASLRV